MVQQGGFDSTGILVSLILLGLRVAVENPDELNKVSKKFVKSSKKSSKMTGGNLQEMVTQFLNDVQPGQQGGEEQQQGGEEQQQGGEEQQGGKEQQEEQQQQQQEQQEQQEQAQTGGKKRSKKEKKDHPVQKANKPKKSK